MIYDIFLIVDRAGALFNAVTKQYGLNTYLLRLALPSPPPPPVTIATPYPRLPVDPEQDSTMESSMQQQNGKVEPPNLLRMNEVDIKATAAFVREFVTTSLIPWMEKSVMDWNESVGENKILFCVKI